MPCHAPLFPCYSLPLLEILSIHHCYTSPRKTFSFPILPSLTPLRGLFSCEHLWCSVGLCKMSCSLSWKDGYQEHFLHLHPLLVIIYPFLVLTTFLVLYKPENESYLSSRKLYRTNRWNSLAIVPVITDESYSILPFLSNNLWEPVGFFLFLNLKCPAKILQQVLSVCLVFCKASWFMQAMPK